MHRTLIKEEEGFSLYIQQDDDAPNPRQDYYNFGIMVCKHPRYTLGDVEIGRQPKEGLPYFPNPDSLVKFLNRKNVIWLPLYLLDHSGLWISAGRFDCDPGGWDTSSVGAIYCTNKMALDNWGKKKLTDEVPYIVHDPKLCNGVSTMMTVKDAAIRLLKAEVETYNQYLSGDVWGYAIEDAEGEDVDSCWGYYGYDYTVSEGESMLKGVIAHRKEEDKKIEEMMHI